MADKFDTIVIGAGPGGYVAAIRAAQLGQKTAVVEKDKPGGRCLNYACIPAKTVLRSAKIYDEARNSADLGVEAEGVTIDWDAMGKRREKVSATLSGGVSGLFKKNGIEMIEGEASLTADGNVKVGRKTYEAGAVILATGSVAMAIPGSSSAAASSTPGARGRCPRCPQRLAVVGAGASGSEIASAYGRFGTEVILVEMLDQLLPAEDKDCAKVVERAFKKQNIEVALGTKVESVDAGKGSVKFKYGDKEAEVDYLCIAGGRAPDVEALKLGDAGVELEESGRVKVDEYQRTSKEGVYAIGDLVRGPALAHKAEDEGVIAAETIAGNKVHPLDLDAVPGATFCHPQVASFGVTEAQAKEQGLEVKVGKFQLGGVGGGTVYDDRAGFVKIIGDPKYGEIVGAHIVGNVACDMISELVNARELEGGYQDIARIIHPHPTISEAVPEAARAVDGWAIHQ